MKFPTIDYESIIYRLHHGKLCTTKDPGIVHKLNLGVWAGLYLQTIWHPINHNFFLDISYLPSEFPFLLTYLQLFWLGLSSEYFPFTFIYSLVCYIVCIPMCACMHTSYITRILDGSGLKTIHILNASKGAYIFIITCKHSAAGYANQTSFLPAVLITPFIALAWLLM